MEQVGEPLVLVFNSKKTDSVLNGLPKIDTLTNTFHQQWAAETGGRVCLGNTWWKFRLCRCLPCPPPSHPRQARGKQCRPEIASLPTGTGNCSPTAESHPVTNTGSPRWPVLPRGDSQPPTLPMIGRCQSASGEPGWQWVVRGCRSLLLCGSSILSTGSELCPIRSPSSDH